MFPLREVDPDEYGHSYVIFRCNICDTETRADYQQYDAERRGSGVCPFCGTKFWGQTIEKCRKCGQTIPRVRHESWGTRQNGTDDIFVPGWRDPIPWDGHFYTPEEWKEREQYDNTLREQFKREEGYTSGNRLVSERVENDQKSPKRWWEFWK